MLQAGSSHIDLQHRGVEVLKNMAQHEKWAKKIASEGGTLVLLNVIKPVSTASTTPPPADSTAATQQQQQQQQVKQTAVDALDANSKWTQ